MGKYSSEKFMSAGEKAIANELAEMNRLKRLELEDFKVLKFGCKLLEDDLRDQA